MELQDLELTSRKVERTEHLIAKFIDGYAAGWEFAVKEVFKGCLDIKKTTKTIDKKTFQIITQGIVYNFDEGDTFHNHKLGYDNWIEFLQSKNPITLQVQFCSSSGYQTKNIKTTITSPLEIKDNSKIKTIKSLQVTEQALNKGNIKVLAYKPNNDKNRMIEDRTIDIPVTDFVSLLQNGTFYDKDTKQYISYKYEG
jgi:hypothetical protein